MQTTLVFNCRDAEAAEVVMHLRHVVFNSTMRPVLRTTHEVDCSEEIQEDLHYHHDDEFEHEDMFSCADHLLGRRQMQPRNRQCCNFSRSRNSRTRKPCFVKFGLPSFETSEKAKANVRRHWSLFNAARLKLQDGDQIARTATHRRHDPQGSAEDLTVRRRSRGLLRAPCLEHDGDCTSHRRKLGCSGRSKAAGKAQVDAVKPAEAAGDMQDFSTQTRGTNNHHCLRCGCSKEWRGWVCYCESCKVRGCQFVSSVTDDISKSECFRCGCTSEFDGMKDRICWCDTCKVTGCSCAPLDDASQVQSSSVPSNAYTHPDDWERLVKRALQTNHEVHHAVCLSRKQLRMRRLQPSAADIRRWSHLHGFDEEKGIIDEHRAMLVSQAPPQHLTLSYQHAHLQVLDATRWERKMRSRWNRLCLTMCMLHRRKARHNAIKDFLPAFYERRQSHNEWGADSFSPWRRPALYERRPSHNEWGASRPEDDESLATALGLDVATYRMLRQLEQRDIVPEDYELLGRLDEAVKPTTLQLEDILRFETRKYLAPVPACNASLEFGFDFWRLPLPLLPEDEPSIAAYGIDFWRLPVAQLEDCSRDSVLDEPSSQYLCGVCLVDFDNDDELRVLPCGHVFHKDCIDHWLLNSSTQCPIDKTELRYID